ncbi:MAG TPA: CinA family protein [Methylomirabilota bacterium]|jgi:nicotinamide mononucleotide (NMN) deamidase PncC|nr:CinA family protein [Methylomirabilota bacterium]
MDFIAQIHASSTMAVVVVTGGGAQAVADLLAVPGASKTVLEALVPYSERALTEFLGKKPVQAVSGQTAAAMARAAYQRALWLRAKPTIPIVGVSCTATLVTDRPKKGEHRAHVGLCTEEAARVYSLSLTKGARDRAGEERIVSNLLLKTLAEACRVPFFLELELLSHEHLEVQEMSPALNKGGNP